MRNVIYLWFLSLLISFPAGASYDDGARYAFLGSRTDKSVSIVDLYRQELATKVRLEYHPDMVTASKNMKALVVAHRRERRLTLIDLTSDRLNQYDHPLSLTPDFIKLSPLGDTLAIHDREQGVLEVQSVRRRQTLLRVTSVETYTDLTFNLDGSSVYWVDQKTGALRVSDLWSKSSSLMLNAHGDGLSAMSRSVDGLLGFVSDAKAEKVYVIDLVSLEKIQEIHVGADPGRPWGTTDGSTMLIPNGGDATITAISTLTLDKLFTVDAVAKPVAVNAGWLDTTAAVIGAEGDVALLDLRKGRVVKKLQFKGFPHEGVVTSDSRTLAVPVAGRGSLALFDMRSRSLAREITGLPSDIDEAVLALSNNLCH